MITEINNLLDVEAFAVQLISEGTAFHPDDDFTQYVKFGGNTQVYSLEEAVLRNDLMEKCFHVCFENGADIYSFMLEVYLRKTKLDDFIPKPSQLS